MPKDEEMLLQELFELLPIEKKDLRTPEEKNAEIDRIIEIWCNLSGSTQTEELLLEVLDRTKMSWKVYWNTESLERNIDNVRKIFDGTKELLKSENSYLKFIEHLKEKFFIYVINEFLDDEKRPFPLQSENDYLKLALIFYNDYKRLSDFIEKHVPPQYRSAEFYKEILNKQSEIGVFYGTGFENFWKLVPDNVKNKELFLEICRRAPIEELNKLFNVVDKSYFDEQFISELPNIIARLYMIIPDGINDALSKLPPNLITQEFYSNLMNEFFEHATPYKSEKLFENTIPDNFKTKDMALSFVRNFSGYTLSQILSNLPDNIKTEQFYTNFFHVYGTNKEYSVQNISYSSVSSTLKQIPKEYFTEQNILNMLFQKQEDPKVSGEFYEIILKFVKDELKELYPNGLSKDFYKKLIKNNPENDLFTIFNSMPIEYKTEDMYIMTLEKNKDHPNLEKSFISKLLQLLKSNPTLSENFSKDFYKRIISASNDLFNVHYFFETIPKEYQTEEMYLDIVSKFRSNRYVHFSVYSLLPKELMTEELYIKIINIVKTQKDENGKVIGNNSEALKLVIRGLPAEYKKRENIINLLSNFKDENGNTIYTPANLIYLNFPFKYSNFIDTQLLEILNSEITNFENGIINENQFTEYENELNALFGLNLTVDSKTELYGLNTAYIILPEDAIPEETKKRFYDIIHNKIPHLKNENNAKVISILSKMFDNNNELFITLDKNFIKSDKYLELFGAEKFEILTLYPDIQRQILALNEKQLSLVVHIIDYVIESQSEQETKLEDWIPILDKILNGFNNNNFKEILENIPKINFDKLDEETIRNLYAVISKTRNYFNINTLENLQNYEEIKQKICENILSNSQDTKNLPKDIRLLTETDRKRFAILQLKYGIDLVEARALIEKYGYDFSEEMMKDETFLELKEIKEILENEDFLETISFTEKRINLSNIESILREKIKKTYQDKLYSVESHAQDQTNNFDSTYNGKELKVYQVQENFNMIIHALGAYSGRKEIQNYRDNWNIAKMRYHGLCTSYIGNNLIATARVSDVIYGFDSIEKTPLLLSAPWDIGSNGVNQKFATANMKARTKFLNPQMQINCTRHTHNEMVYDRRNFKKGDISQKMQPSYIVYIPEYLDGKTSQEIDAILSNNSNNTEIQEFMKKDKLWEKTKKAAAQFDVPIVIIDRLHYAQREKQKIEENLKSFEETLDPQLLTSIITEFENNRTGYREYHKSICEKFFSDKIMNTYLTRIVQAIEKSKNDPRLQLSNYEELTRLISVELENRNSFGKTEDDKITQYWNEKLQNIESQKNKLLRKHHGLEETDNSNELEFIINTFKITNEFKEELKFINQETYEQIQDMKERNLYDGKLLHSDRHIQNVMLFSGILGQQFGLTSRQQMLLLEAAKFHDAGRINDGDRNHALASANIAGNKLKRIYSSEDLKIIQIAIEYHEVVEKDTGKLDKVKLQELFDKYELDTGHYDEAAKIAEILKDADALDRTRFAERGRLKEVYLHSDKSRSLVNFATALNEQYAKRDIEEMLQLNSDIRTSVQSYKERTGKTWLSVLRDIRTRKFIPKSNKNITSKELAEASIPSLPNIEMLDAEDQALSQLLEQEKEGVQTNE